MNKNKFGFIIGELGKGGQETQLKYLITKMQEKGNQCYLIVWKFEEVKARYAEEIRKAGVHLLLFNTESYYEKIKLSRIFLNQNKVVSLHSFTHYLNFYTWLLCLFSSTMPIGGIRSQIKIIRSKYGFIRFWLNAIFPTRKISNNYSYLYGIKNPLISLAFRKTEVITNQLDVSKFKSIAPKKENLIRTASVGQLSFEKSIDILIHAINKLVKRGYNVQHSHAGTGVLQNKLDALVDSMGLQNNFLFKGEVSNISSFLNDKYLFIHSSTFEGYPNVIMEAMTCGKAIISTDCGDVRFLVENDVNGFIVAVGDAEMIANKIEILFNDENLLCKLSKNSRNKAKKNFKLSHLLEKTYKIYIKFGVQL